MSICSKLDTPRRGTLGKRKEPEYYSSSTSEQQRALPVMPKPRKPVCLSRFAKPPMPPPPQGGSNKLLAGYLAHEFLRFGTLLGEQRTAPIRKETAAASPTPVPPPERRYALASMLLVAGGTRIPGVVNPTQLGRWLRIME